MSLLNSQLTASGFVRTSLSNIVSALNTIWQGAFGADADIDPRSADGNIIGSIAEMFDDLNGIAGDTLNLANPNGATGNMLANLAYLTGIAKNGASFPSAPCTFTGTPTTVVPYTFTVKSTVDGTSWMPPQSPAAQYVIGSGGTVTGSLICTTIGPLVSGGPAPAATLTQIVTITAGIASVTNTVGIPGAVVEGDPNLRIRRQNATAIASQAMTDGMQAAIQALPGVVNAVVWENNLGSPVTIGTGGSNVINANTVRAIVQVTPLGSADPSTTGSGNDPIANLLWTLKGNACNTQGAWSKYPLDNVGNSHLIQYDTAQALATSVRINIAPRSNFPTDGIAQIKQAVSNWGAGVDATTGRPNIQISGDDKGTLSWTDVLSSFVATIPGFDFLDMEFSNPVLGGWTTSPQSMQVPFGYFVAISSVTVNGA